mgnify:FL=1
MILTATIRHNQLNIPITERLKTPQLLFDDRSFVKHRYYDAKFSQLLLLVVKRLNSQRSAAAASLTRGATKTMLARNYRIIL